MTALTLTTTPARMMLRVVQPEAVVMGQDCSTCRNMRNCWSGDENNRMLALLVCRLQRGIDRDKSARSILEMLRPKLKKIAHWIAVRTGAARRDVFADVSSRVIEQLITTYVIGELVPLVVWLFHARYGGIRHWAMQVVERGNRERRMLSYDARSEESFEERILGLNVLATDGKVHTFSFGEVDLAAVEMGTQLSHALELLEDGRTLKTAEYRALRFHLTNSRRGASHQWLADRMRVARQDLSAVSATAMRKIVQMVEPRRARPRGVVAERVVLSRPATEAAVTLGVSVRYVKKLRQVLRSRV
jgi:hypothetical protein